MIAMNPLAMAWTIGMAAAGAVLQQHIGPTWPTWPTGTTGTTGPTGPTGLTVPAKLPSTAIANIDQSGEYGEYYSIVGLAAILVLGVLVRALIIFACNAADRVKENLVAFLKDRVTSAYHFISGSKRDAMFLEIIASLRADVLVLAQELQALEAGRPSPDIVVTNAPPPPPPPPQRTSKVYVQNSGSNVVTQMMAELQETLIKRGLKN